MLAGMIPILKLEANNLLGAILEWKGSLNTRDSIAMTEDVEGKLVSFGRRGCVFGK
jgi:hypothetical protein